MKRNISSIKNISGLCILTVLTIFTINSVFAQDEQQSPSPSQQLNLTQTSLPSLTGIPYPDIPHENPDAVKHTEKFTPSKVIEVTDGIYSAVGYGMANVMMIEGTDGIIIVDAGENNVQAKKVLSEFRKITDKPIVAVIYTHNHVDHTEGGGVFVKDGEAAGQKVAVIGQASLVDNYYKSYGALASQQSQFGMRWTGSFLPHEGEDRVISNGIGPMLEPGNTSFIPPNVTFNKTLETEYAGIKMVIGSQPGETPDELYVWLPDQKVLFVGENIYELYPNLYSMRGTKYRDVSLWIDSLDKLRSFNASYMVPSHTRPVTGQENVSKILTGYRDGVAYIYDQTIRNINKGLNPDELVQQIQLPPYLKDHPWLQERYGQVSWMVKGIYTGEVGWNTGDAIWFNPVSDTERGKYLVEGFGGQNQTLAKIKDAIKEGKYNWAAELATYLLNAYPDSEEAKLLKAQAYRVLGWMNPTSGARNWYITDARILEGQLDPKLLEKIYGAEERIMNTPTDILLSLARYKIDPTKSGDMNMTLGIKLNDTNEGYKLQIRQAVLEFKNMFPSQYDIAINTDGLTLKQVIAGVITLDDAIESGKIKVTTGSVDDFKKFVSVLDTGLKGYPVDSKALDIG